tara:strand:- start:183623 stop:184330 length:708 start_codon:yes stop_codon:yes gene_type:complete
MKFSITIFILFINLSVLTQVNISFETETNEELFLHMTNSGRKSPNSTYESGELKEVFFYNETYSKDSVKRYYENGNIAFEGYCFKKTLIENNPLTESSYFLKSFEKSYYQDSSLRSVYYYDINLGKTTSLFHYYSESCEQIVYSKEWLHGLKINGLFQKFIPETKKWIFEIYRHGKLIEKWYASSINYSESQSYLVVNKVETSKSKVLTKKRKIRRHFSTIKLVRVGGQFIIYQL